MRIALVVLFVGVSAMVAWDYVAQLDRAYQSNVPGIDPGNPLAQYGIESDEHKAYVAAKVRNIRYGAVLLETGVITGTIVLWLVMPIFSRDWVKTHPET
ncbi:MAG TPA: hypothetical protein VMH02_03535 [Verrucomicrobiae bacterium]|nr:hypothetical protein [Verrucomicrobiae bacterium]